MYNVLCFHHYTVFVIDQRIFYCVSMIFASCMFQKYLNNELFFLTSVKVLSMQYALSNRKYISTGISTFQDAVVYFLPLFMWSLKNICNALFLLMLNYSGYLRPFIYPAGDLMLRLKVHFSYFPPPLFSPVFF